MITNYYAKIAALNRLQAKVLTLSITASAVLTQRQALLNLQTLKKSLRNETAEAQTATDTRNRAFDALYPQYSEYIKVRQNPPCRQSVLEAIGV